MNRLSSKLVAKKPAKGKQKPVPVKIVSEPMDSPQVDNSWRARSDLRALQEAEEIRRDRARLSAAKKEAKTMMRDLSKVCK